MKRRGFIGTLLAIPAALKAVRHVKKEEVTPDIISYTGKWNFLYTDEGWWRLYDENSVIRANGKGFLWEMRETVSFIKQTMEIKEEIEIHKLHTYKRGEL